jgi:hypothetical protein
VFQIRLENMSARKVNVEVPGAIWLEQRSNNPGVLLDQPRDMYGEREDDIPVLFQQMRRIKGILPLFRCR